MLSILLRTGTKNVSVKELSISLLKEIDLYDLEIDRNRKISVNTAFSDTVILINDSIQVHIKASSAFGSVSLPTGDSVSFGETNFVIGSSDKILYLNVNAAFAQIRVLYK